MRRNWLKRITSVFVAAAHLLLSVVMVAPGLVHAQSVDVDPPVIELEVVNEGVRGETQVFSATASDNNDISSMTLHYRLGSASNYDSVPMSQIAGTSIYTASVDTANASVDLIQYYMEARDSGGNRTVQGFAFDPFERTLVDDQTVFAEAPAETGAVVPAVVPPRMSTQRKVVYGVLAALLVGGLAAASRGSSGGGGGEETDLTIIVDNF